MRQLTGEPGAVTRSNFALTQPACELIAMVGTLLEKSKHEPESRIRYCSRGRMVTTMCSSSILSQPIGLR